MKDMKIKKHVGEWRLLLFCAPSDVFTCDEVLPVLKNIKWY